MSKQNLLRSESTASTSTSTSKKVPKNNLWRYVNISAMFSYVSVETKYFKDKQEALDFSYKDAVFNGYLDESFDWEKEDEDCPLDEEEESYRNKVEMAKEEPYKNEGGKYFFNKDIFCIITQNKITESLEMVAIIFYMLEFYHYFSQYIFLLFS